MGVQLWHCLFGLLPYIFHGFPCMFCVEYYKKGFLHDFREFSCVYNTQSHDMPTFRGFPCASYIDKDASVAGA